VECDVERYRDNDANFEMGRILGSHSNHAKFGPTDSQVGAVFAKAIREINVGKCIDVSRDVAGRSANEDLLSEDFAGIRRKDGAAVGSRTNDHTTLQWFEGNGTSTEVGETYDTVRSLEIDETGISGNGLGDADGFDGWSTTRRNLQVIPEHDYFSRPSKRTQPGNGPVLGSLEDCQDGPSSSSVYRHNLLERRGLETSKHAPGGVEQEGLRQPNRSFACPTVGRVLTTFPEEGLCRVIGMHGDGGPGVGGQHQLDPQAQDRFRAAIYDDALHVNPAVQVRHDVRDSEDRPPHSRKIVLAETVKRIIEGRHTGAIPGYRHQRYKDANKWPAHCPAVETIRLDDLLQDPRFPKELAQRIKLLLSGESDYKLDTNTARSRESNFHEIDPIEDMLRVGVIEVADEEDSVNCVVFLIPEPAKYRWRIITWPLMDNQSIIYEWSPLAVQADVLEFGDDVQAMGNEVGCSFDLKVSFYQIELERLQRRRFVFSCKGKTYRMVRLPMGWRPSAEIMQLLLQGISRMALQPGARIGFRVHVDNVLFIGPVKDIQATFRKFERICAEFNVTLGTVCSPSARIAFHSVVLNFNTRTISLADRAIAKLIIVKKSFERHLRTCGRAAPWKLLEEDSLENSHSGATHYPLLKALALLTYYARIGFEGSNFQRGCMADHWALMQLVRGAATATQSGAKSVLVTKQVCIRALTLLQVIPRNFCPSRVYAGRPYFNLFTDASTTGAGFVINNAPHIKDKTWIWSKPYPRPDQMATAELAAIFLAISSIPPGTCIALFSDSTPALGALRRGYSPSRLVNSWVSRIWHTSRSQSIAIARLEYVSTLENPADEGSRAGTGTTANWHP
jgi:hypothetical protein